MFSSNDESGLVKVLSLLKAHPTEYLSGQDLSDVLKISRVAVWKHIQKIRELGYTIESKQKLGYRLESNTDALLPWEIMPELGTESIGRNMYYFDTTDSTQRQAIGMAANGAPDGTIIIAKTQSDGRGRSSKRWISPKGSIGISVILRPRFDILAITLFPMAASLALSSAIKKTLDIQTHLKWPNDLVLKDKKVAGILVDASLESNRIESLILGVGINFDIDAKSVEKMLKDTPNFYGASSLLKNKKTHPRILVRMFLEELENVYYSMNRGETDWIVKEWTRLSCTIGRNISVSTAGKTISGKAIRMDDDGALMVRKDGKLVRVMAGDIVHV